jgi:hypothetical protein
MPSAYALSSNLANEALSLSIKNRNSTTLAVSPRRTSVVNADYREMLTVRLDWNEDAFFARDYGRLKLGQITVSTTLYVNRLNTSDPEDWHLPTPEQQQTYNDALLQAMKQAVSRRCTSPAWLDSFTVACASAVPPGARVTLP